MGSENTGMVIAIGRTLCNSCRPFSGLSFRGLLVLALCYFFLVLLFWVRWMSDVVRWSMTTYFCPVIGRPPGCCWPAESGNVTSGRVSATAVKIGAKSCILRLVVRQWTVISEDCFLYELNFKFHVSTVSSSFLYCVSKNVPPLTFYNLGTHNPIAIIFGRSVTRKIRNHTMLCFPTSGNPEDSVLELCACNTVQLLQRSRLPFFWTMPHKSPKLTALVTRFRKSHSSVSVSCELWS